MAGKLKFVTPAHSYLMRGVNYRCSTILHLLICTPLPNERALQQALGRVCRYKDKGTRSVLTGVELFDSAQQHALIARLGQSIVRRREAKREQKKNEKLQRALNKGDGQVKPKPGKKGCDSVSASDKPVA